MTQSETIISNVPKFRLHMFVTKNNLKVILTDMGCVHTFYRKSTGKVSTYLGSTIGTEISNFLIKQKEDTISLVVRGRGGIKSPSIGYILPLILKIFMNNDIKTLGKIENVTPLPHDGTKRAHGRRGRRP